MNEAPITKKTLEHLAELARIEISDKGPASPKLQRGEQETKNKEEKLLKDLQKILEHFEELKEADTENAEPTRPPSISSPAKSGEPVGDSIFLENVFRDDEIQETRDKRQRERDKLIDAFPEKEGNFLKVPPIFE